MKKSLKTYLLERAKSHEGLITFRNIEKWTDDAYLVLGRRYKVSNSERRMRELCEEGRLHRTDDRYVTYEYRPIEFTFEPKVDLQPTLDFF